MIFRSTPIFRRLNYSTTFAATENPISEGGVWRQTDSNQTKVRTSGGYAFGTMAGGSFDDSHVYFPSFGSSHEIEYFLHKGGSIPGVNHEWEILLSYSDDGPEYTSDFGLTRARGYEINVAHDGSYYNLGHWKALPGLIEGAGLGFTPAHGDRFWACVDYNAAGTQAIIDCTLAGIRPAGFPYTDNSPPGRGHPGMGFYIQATGDITQVGALSAIVKAR